MDQDSGSSSSNKKTVYCTPLARPPLRQARCPSVKLDNRSLTVTAQNQHFLAARASNRSSGHQTGLGGSV